MAGIYIHIPFCKQACNYCDFHFSTTLNKKDAFLQALYQEIVLQKNYLENETINTIYLGGGTPSLLSQKELLEIIDILHQHFTIDPNAEITLEANPDDLSLSKIKELSKTPINRFSVGIQSFFDDDLQFMNRAHNAQEAKNVIPILQDAGFENITIDLIYGTPTQSNEKWEANLQTAFDLEVNHISAYSLTVEENTALAHLIKTNKCENIDDETSARHFEIMLKKMQENNFTQYEISNFCKDDAYSKHNSNYWLKQPYLGLGPSAHSYNGKSRQWNISNNIKYINTIAKGVVDFEQEVLTPHQRFNEYILTALRTIWGVDLTIIESEYGIEVLQQLLQQVAPYITSNKVSILNNKITLTDKGKLITDKISSDLFIV